MPLPAALAARLKKRGLLKETENKQTDDVEEVFAEDYDDPMKEGIPPVPEELPPSEPPPEDKKQELIYDIAACPNRSNPYHTCVAYCSERWGIKNFTASPTMLRKRDRMLRRYPLPEGWEEVADPETNRYYYWNALTDQVSWLSPLHPKAQITMSAQRIQEMLGETVTDASQDDMRSDEEEMDVNQSESDLSSSSSSSSESEDEEYDRRRKGRHYGDRDNQDSRDRNRNNNRGRGRQKREELDPMDPAAYSEAPRGTWSSGLSTRGDAKTGADVTASGPLFQQRPYPSPGEILRRNKDQK